MLFTECKLPLCLINCRHSIWRGKWDSGHQAFCIFQEVYTRKLILYLYHFHPVVLSSLSCQKTLWELCHSQVSERVRKALWLVTHLQLIQLGGPGTKNLLIWKPWGREINDSKKWCILSLYFRSWRAKWEGNYPDLYLTATCLSELQWHTASYVRGLLT